MTLKPTQTQRSVLLALKFMKYGDVQLGSKWGETPRVTAISALFADCDSITVEIFSDQDEAALLHRFWLSIRAGDRVFAANAAAGLSMLRHRSWMLDVLPSPDIDLRCVYGLEMWDTGKMWAAGYVPYPLHVDEHSSPVEVPFDEAYGEVTVHSREVTVHSRD